MSVRGVGGSPDETVTLHRWPISGTGRWSRWEEARTRRPLSGDQVVAHVPEALLTAERERANRLEKALTEWDKAAELPSEMRKWAQALPLLLHVSGWADQLEEWARTVEAQ